MVYIHSYHYNMEAGLPIHKASDSSGWHQKAVGEFFLYTQQQMNKWIPRISRMRSYHIISYMQAFFFKYYVEQNFVVYCKKLKKYSA